METTEIINALDRPGPDYRRDAVDAAVAARQAITPFLLAVLADVLADPIGYADSGRNGLTYALPLLAHFGESAAHERLLQIASLDEGPLDALLGDMITETLPIALWQTCDKGLEGIKTLLANRSASVYSRSGAADVLVYGVAEGLASRDAVLELLAAQLSDDPEDDILNGLVGRSMLELWPNGYDARLRQLLDQALVDPWSFTDEELDEALALDLDDCLASAREGFERRIPTDIHGYLAGFAWSSEESDEDGTLTEGEQAFFDWQFRQRLAELGSPAPMRGSVARSEKEKRKKQRKASAKARKKNRKKR